MKKGDVIKSLIDLCQVPKTTHEIKAAGISRHAIYYAIRMGKLVNLRPGRKGNAECGLFVVSEWGYLYQETKKPVWSGW